MEPSTNVDGDKCSGPRESSVGGCFNGAVDERRRRPSCHVLTEGWDSPLQWSRRRTSTETATLCSAMADAGLASMEPSTNVDGDKPAELPNNHWYLRRHTRAVPQTDVIVNGVKTAHRGSVCLVPQLTASSSARGRAGIGPLESLLDDGLFDCHRTSTTSDDDDRSLGTDVSPPNSVDTTARATVNRSKIEEKDLIILMIDQDVERCVERNAFSVGEIAPKHRILDVISKATQCGEHLAAPFVVTNVVGDDEPVAHVLPRCEGWIFGNLAG